MSRISPETETLAAKVERIARMMRKLLADLPFCDPDIEDLEQAAAALRRSGVAQRPDLGENREADFADLVSDAWEAKADARKLEKLLHEGIECTFDDNSVTIFISDESEPSVGLDGGLRLSLSCNYEVIPVSLLRDIKAAMGDNWERCLDLWRQTYAIPTVADTSTDRPDGYRNAWLQMIAHCNEVKADRFRLEQTIRDSIEALERNSTSAPVVECLKAALPVSSPVQTKE
jgi:hypothetical protein